MTLALQRRPGGPAEEVRPAQPGRLSVLAAGASTAVPGSSRQLQVLVLADVVARVARRGRARVRLLAPRGSPSATEAELLQWNLRVADPWEPAGQVPVDVVVWSGPGPPGPAIYAVHPEPGHDQPLVSADPLAWRLSLLAHDWRQPLGGRDAAADEARLAQWRAAIARAAEHPSAAPDRARVTTALQAAGRLDTAAVCGVLAQALLELADEPGQLFETAMLLDHVLGLDLAAEVGR